MSASTPPPTIGGEEEIEMSESEYECCMRVLTILVDKSDKATLPSDAKVYTSLVIDMIDCISSAKKQQSQFMQRENERLWSMVKDEYMTLSGQITTEWMESEHGRMQALAALEGHPRRLRQQGMFNI